jgi:hypothetical protein
MEIRSKLLTPVTGLAGGFSGDHLSAATIEGPNAPLVPRGSPARQQPGRACAEEGHSALQLCAGGGKWTERLPVRFEWLVAA